MMAPLSSILPVVLLVSPLLLQQSVEVDVARDFPGIVEVFESEYREFYDYPRFEAYHRKKVSPAELEDLKRAWEEERRKGDAKRATIEKDPEQLYLFHLDQRLSRRGSYFRDLQYQRVDDFKPFYLLVEKPKKRGFESFHRTVAEFYGPWLKELLRIFEEEYARPGSLVRRKEHGGFALLVLTDRKEYDRYYASLGLGYAPYVRAHYDPELQLGVTYEEPGSLAVSDAERRVPALHEMVHAFEYAYGPGEKEALQLAWFAEGFADYLAYHDIRSKEPSALRTHSIDGQELTRFVEWASDSGKASVLFPIEELGRVHGYDQAVERALGRAKALGLEAPQPQAAIGLLYTSSYLWMHFLHNGEKGRYREGIHDYICAAIGNRVAEKPLTDFLKGVSAADLNAQFLRYVAEEWKRSESAAAAPSLPPLKHVELSESPLASTSGGARPAPPPLTVEPELELTAALGDARAGRLEGSAALLRALIVRADAGDLRARAERELARVEGAIDVRRRFFEELSSSRREKLRLPGEERPWYSFVQSVDGDVVQLQDNPRELRLEELPASYLAEQIGDEKKYEFRAGWVLAYFQLLAGDPAWEKTLVRCSGPEARGLEGDAADLMAQAGRAETASALVAVARRGTGTTAAEAQAVFDGVRELLRTHGDTALVKEHRPALLGRARAALERLYQAREPESLLHGRWEQLGPDRARLSYGFDSEEELRDFEVEPIAEILENAKEVGASLVQTRIERSSLVAVGFLRLWNHVRFATPLEITYEFTERIGVVQNEGQQIQLPLTYLIVGVLASARDDAITIHELDGITEWEAGQAVRRPTRIQEARLERKFSLVVRVDNGRVTMTVDGQPVRPAGCKPDREGGLFLETYGRIDLHSLTITGRPTADSFAHWREGWIDEQMAAAGLK